METNAPITIDTSLCTGCGQCTSVCVNFCLDVIGGQAQMVNEHCILCDHCVAACPEGAIACEATSGQVDFGPFAHSREWIGHGDFDAGELTRLMRSRRSCRNFSEQAVDRGLLEQLCHVGTTAPSGTNSQRWTFTVLPTRPAVMALGRHVAQFFRKVNKMAEKAWLRNFLALIGQKDLKEYFQEYYRQVSDALKRYDDSGEDRLFHGATAVIVVGSLPGASCPAEDALLATQNILLAAHAAGLGTCLIGYAVEAMHHERSIQRILGWDKHEEVYAVIALGHPDEEYTGLTGRKNFSLRVLDDLK